MKNAKKTPALMLATREWEDYNREMVYNFSLEFFFIPFFTLWRRLA